VNFFSRSKTCGSGNIICSKSSLVNGELIMRKVILAAGIVLAMLPTTAMAQKLRPGQTCSEFCADACRARQPSSMGLCLSKCSGKCEITGAERRAAKGKK
jgi:hypothetical protein